jgi:hypothetical protein
MTVTFPQDNDLKPGTWKRGMGANGPTALIRCPKCRGIASLSDHCIDEHGVVQPSLVCPHDDCGFHEFVNLGGW